MGAALQVILITSSDLIGPYQTSFGPNGPKWTSAEPIGPHQTLT